MTTITMDMLSDDEVREALSCGCDFDIRDGSTVPAWFAIEGVSGYEVVAADGGGGSYVVIAPLGHVLFVSSEGQAGIIAASLTEAIEMMVACPHWRDLLKFSGGGKLEEMRRAHPELEAARLDDDPDGDEARDLLREALPLSQPADPLGSLHRAVSQLGAGITVRDPDGSALEPLFNRLTIDDLPRGR